MLENALAAGIMSLGVDVLLIGPLPTPGVAYITRSLRADAGIVLSASHNPYEDNGIKFFRHDGYKLDDEIEPRIEDLVFSGEIEIDPPHRGQDRPGDAHRRRAGPLRRVCQAQLPARAARSKDMRIAVDVRQRRRLQIHAVHPARARRERHRRAQHARTAATSTAIAAAPTRRKSSASSRKPARRSASRHDGDADRVLLCDENGEIVDGDEIMAIAAIDFLKRGRLAQNTLVATVMSNFGLDEALADARRPGHPHARSATATSSRR